MDRLAKTNPKGKALCLHHGCSRVAKHEISFKSRVLRWGYSHQVVCDKCLESYREDPNVKDVEVLQTSPKGFTVTTSLFGPVTRTYHPSL